MNDKEQYNMVFENRIGEKIRVHDVVYNNRKGESGVPMKVLKMRELRWHDRVIPQAYCEGTNGWGFAPEWFAIQNLTHTPNLWGEWPGASNE